MSQEDMKAVIEAKRQIAEGSLTMWNERLRALANMGDVRGYLKALDRPLELAADNTCNNCDCDKRLPNLEEFAASGVKRT